MNNLDEEIILGLGQIFSNFTKNFVYMFFKKDSLSQKIFSLFFFFITYKTRKISQLFFETIFEIKNFIRECYKFSNYSEDEKIQFMKFLIKILLNIINKCILKSIPKKQDIILDEEYITIKNINLTGMNNNNNIIISNEKEEEDSDDTNEMSVNDYRKFQKLLSLIFSKYLLIIMKMKVLFTFLLR